LLQFESGKVVAVFPEFEPGKNEADHPTRDNTPGHPSNWQGSLHLGPWGRDYPQADVSTWEGPRYYCGSALEVSA
jgi:hypothetical protein